ncbi:hypothetical protein BFP97_10310 [Roseivirga sp. 4D4]|nr:hypothetical protein BFP97_10310 [Roseivirga sp. 4D4]
MTKPPWYGDCQAIGMPKSRLRRFFTFLIKGVRTLMMAYMVGIANIVNQETKFMDDTNDKIEVVEREADDDPFK